MISTADDVIEHLTRAGTLADFRKVGDAVQRLADPRLKNICTIHGTEINPFFVPNAQPGTQPLNVTQWLYIVSQARAAAAHGSTRRMMVAAPMKSGSTFITKSLSTAFGLPRVSLIMLLARAYDYANLGAATRAHEIDELALISACCRADGFIAHHHMLGSPYLASQATLYRLDVLLIRRNIFDMLVSLDDFTRKNLAENAKGETFFRFGVPANYASLDFDDRIARLLDRNLDFYLNYYVSWTLAESQGLIKPFWISYEDEISGGTRALSGRVTEAFARTDDEAVRVAAALGEGGRMEHVHFNKGVAGRGQAITGRNRERVRAAFADFSDVADWSDLLA
ncbi:MAG: hypothetical protein KL863_24775 [Rhizobium sp.]|nr:hypothetical protein [Rhizobium sp.]